MPPPLPSPLAATATTTTPAAAAAAAACAPPESRQLRTADLDESLFIAVQMDNSQLLTLLLTARGSTWDPAGSGGPGGLGSDLIGIDPPVSLGSLAHRLLKHAVVHDAAACALLLCDCAARMTPTGG